MLFVFNSVASKVVKFVRTTGRAIGSTNDRQLKQTALDGASIYLLFHSTSYPLPFASYFFSTFANIMTGLLDYSLWGLFLASFLAATVVPFSSEIVLTAVLTSGTDVYLAVIIASLGNWVGGMTSYALGYLGKWEWIEKYLRIKRETIEKWHNRMYKRGAIFAFLSWVPGVGDIFVVGLGLLRANVWLVGSVMLAGKFLRYVVWAWLTGLIF